MTRHTPERLNEILEYDPDSGHLTWRVRVPADFKDGQRTAEQNCRWWNGRYVGKRAGYPNNYGQLTFTVLKQKENAQRMIWAMQTGEWPEAGLFVGHINHVPSDNRWINLRVVTCAENQKNLSLASNNTSGHTGVFWYKATQEWRAQIKIDGKTKYLGTFTDLSDAVAARAAANVKYGFHPNHGSV